MFTFVANLMIAEISIYVLRDPLGITMTYSIVAVFSFIKRVICSFGLKINFCCLKAVIFILNLCFTKSGSLYSNQDSQI